MTGYQEEYIVQLYFGMRILSVSETQWMRAQEKDTRTRSRMTGRLGSPQNSRTLVFTQESHNRSKVLSG